MGRRTPPPRKSSPDGRRGLSGKATRVRVRQADAPRGSGEPGPPAPAQEMRSTGELQRVYLAHERNVALFSEGRRGKLV